MGGDTPSRGSGKDQERELAELRKMVVRLQEDVQILTGKRGATGKPESAVLREEYLAHNHDGVYEPALSVGTTSQFLRGDKTWSVPQQADRFPIVVGGTTTSPADGSTLYFGSAWSLAFVTTAALRQVVVPFDGTINIAQVLLNATGTAGSSESVSVYIRKNNTTDTLIGTVGVSAQYRAFNNANIGLSVVAGDKLEIKVVCPTWATNPTGVVGCGVLLLEAP